MRRPTPYAVPLVGLQVLYGLSLLAQKCEEDRPMTDTSKRTQRMTAGLDLGDRDTHKPVSARHRKRGELIEERAGSAHHPRGVEEAFLPQGAAAHRHRGRNPLSLGEPYPRGVRRPRSFGGQNAPKVRLIYGDERNNDKLDAENLARLALGRSAL
jgi:hypothetical protein